jgi:UPF0716 protein FxsA
MPLLLFLLFIVVPVIELYVIIQVGQAIGALWTVVLLLFVSVVGAWLVKREGLKAWRRFRTALDQARLPTVEVVDGALVLFGGALLLTPGFISDILGLLLIAPPSRAVLNRLVRSRIRLTATMAGAPGRRRVRPRRDDDVDVEVLDVKRSQ